MNAYLMIAFGSALGGGGRYWATAWITRLAGPGFPWGTLFVNCLGSLLLGVITAALLVPGRLPPEAGLALVTGLCGSFTTVSAFSLQTLALARQGQWWLGLVNIAGSVSGCLLMVWLGLMIGSLLPAAT